MIPRHQRSVGSAEEQIPKLDDATSHIHIIESLKVNYTWKKRKKVSGQRYNGKLIL